VIYFNEFKLKGNKKYKFRDVFLKIGMLLDDDVVVVVVVVVVAAAVVVVAVVVVVVVMISCTTQHICMSISANTFDQL